MECAYVIEEWNGRMWVFVGQIIDESNSAAEWKAQAVKRDIEETTGNPVRVEPREALFSYAF